MRDPDGFEGYGTILELLEKDRFWLRCPMDTGSMG